MEGRLDRAEFKFKFSVSSWDSCQSAAADSNLNAASVTQ